MDYLERIGAAAQRAGRALLNLTEDEINACLRNIADVLESQSDLLISANESDIRAAREKQIKESLIDRLLLTKPRIAKMAEGLREVAALKSPVGETIYSYRKENGLKIAERRVPFGVIGIIYESRPNVSADAFALCFKTANAVILRGGSDALHSNRAIVGVLRQGLRACGIEEDAVTLIEDPSRQTAESFMRLNRYVDLLIPRGGAGLIQSVKERATVPVIETGTGNCHIYIDEFADLGKAVPIVFNAKTQRYGVCNACESLVVHEKIAAQALPLLKKKLDEKQVELRGDDASRAILAGMTAATEEDFGMEYLDAVLSVKIVSSLNEAIEHINRYHTGHSDAIITENKAHAEKFMREVDSAAVYVNASTRFTDGNEFGFGAEIGISTQKLHARGPMGLTALTTAKFFCYGDGQIRE